MNSIAYLKAAYVVAWVIYLGYLGRILLRMKRVEAAVQSLEVGHRVGKIPSGVDGLREPVCSPQGSGHRESRGEVGDHRW